MATVAALHAREAAQWGYLLVIEGLDYAFTDTLDLADGSGWWDEDNRTVLPGLEVPPSLVIESDPRTGLLRDNSARFRLLDTYDDVLATMFRTRWGNELDQVTARVEPDTTWATDDIATLSGGHAIYGQHLGLERIGASSMGGTIADGDRRAYYITPSNVPPGLDFPWIAGADIADAPPTYVSASPYAFAGRRVALYRVVYDPDSGAWPSFSDQYDGGSLIWVGSISGTGRMIDVGKFEIDCGGPESWTRKPLNQNRPPQWRPVASVPDLADGEKGVAVWFNEAEWGVSGVTTSGYHASLFDAAQDIDDDNPADIASHVQAIVSGAVSGSVENTSATSTTAFSTDGNATFDGATARIQITNAATTNHYGEMRICLHLKVWSALGWDPVIQEQLSRSSSKFAVFAPFDPTHQVNSTIGETISYRAQGSNPLDWGGYWVGVFPTYNPESQDIVLEGADNGGNWRHTEALYPAGIVRLVAQPQYVTLGMDSVYCEGQLASPASNALPRPQINGADVDAAGWFVFRGKIARGVSPFDDSVEFDDYVQIARCSWVNSGGQIGRDATQRPRIHVERWENPRAFGFDHDRMTRPWLAGGTTQIECAPIGVWATPFTGGLLFEPDHAHNTITRILCSTGTAGPWQGGGQLQWLLEGDNHPTGSTWAGDEFWGGDVTIADMGLGVPRAAIDFDSFVDCAEALEGSRSDPLNRVVYASLGPARAEDILSQALSGRGWAFGWKRSATDKHPRWSCYSVVDPIAIGDVEITLTESDKAGDVEDNRTWISDQELQFSAPVDRFRIRARQNPITGDYAIDETVASLDREARGRGGRVSYEITDGGLSDYTQFSGWQAWTWILSWRRRFARLHGEWYARSNSLVTMTISPTQGQFCYPGTAVRLTDPRVYNAGGSYGITDVTGRIIRTELVLTGKFGGCTRAGILVGQEQVSDAILSGTRQWAPGGRVWSHNSTTSTLYLTGPWDGDFLGMGGSHDDIDGFEEPAWSTTAGTATIEVLQSMDGGDTWGDAWTADISSVDTAAKSIVYTNTSGTLYRDADKIVRFLDYDNQAAGNWVTSIFYVLADGLTQQFGSGPTDAWRLG